MASGAASCSWLASALMRPLLCLGRPFLPFLASQQQQRPAPVLRAGGTDAEQAFQKAATAVSASTSLPVKLKLRLYALYKQSTVGEASVTPPAGSVLDPAAQLKWRAWSQLRGTSSDEAMRLYVREADAALGDGGEDVLLDDVAAADDAEEELLGAFQGFAGPVMSSMAASEPSPEEEEEETHPWSELHGAARRGDETGVACWLRNGHPADIADDEGHTALHWASDLGYGEIVQLLLDHGAVANARNCDGSTPLHMACASEHLAVLEKLMEAGADPLAEDEDGCTPASFASEAIAKRLRQPSSAQGDPPSST